MLALGRRRVAVQLVGLADGVLPIGIPSAVALHGGPPFVGDCSSRSGRAPRAVVGCAHREVAKSGGRIGRAQRECACP